VPTLFSGAAVVEAADAEKLEELLASGLRDYTVRRLGPTAVQVDHARLDDVRKLLKRLGQTPRNARD
jgi:hypothetical protein